MPAAAVSKIPGVAFEHESASFLLASRIGEAERHEVQAARQILDLVDEDDPPPPVSSSASMPLTFIFCNCKLRCAERTINY